MRYIDAKEIVEYTFVFTEDELALIQQYLVPVKTELDEAHREMAEEILEVIAFCIGE